MTQMVNGDSEKMLQMIRQAKRDETFKSWPFGNDKPCSAEKLAEAGFYFTGSSEEPDTVQCFLCDKELDGWEESDDPWVQHRIHSPNCAFARLGQPEEALSLQQMSDFKVQQVKKEIKKSMQALERSTNKEFNKRLSKNKKTLQGLLRKI